MDTKLKSIQSHLVYVTLSYHVVLTLLCVTTRLDTWKKKWIHIIILWKKKKSWIWRE